MGRSTPNFQWFIRTDSDWKFGYDQSDLKLIRINSDWFSVDFHRMRFKMFFGLVQNDSETDFEMARIHSDWIPFETLAGWVCIFWNSGKDLNWGILYSNLI